MRVHAEVVRWCPLPREVLIGRLAKVGIAAVYLLGLGAIIACVALAGGTPR